MRAEDKTMAHQLCQIEGNLMQHDHDFHQLCQKEKAQVASFTKLQCMHDMAFFVYNINVLKN